MFCTITRVPSHWQKFTSFDVCMYDMCTLNGWFPEDGGLVQRNSKNICWSSVHLVCLSPCVLYPVFLIALVVVTLLWLTGRDAGWECGSWLRKCVQLLNTPYLSLSLSPVHLACYGGPPPILFMQGEVCVTACCHAHFDPMASPVGVPVSMCMFGYVCISCGCIGIGCSDIVIR